jgi:hypothetical protein
MKSDMHLASHSSAKSMYLLCLFSGNILMLCIPWSWMMESL